MRLRGFTLIEMLVAITILAVIALMSWRGLDAVSRTRDAVSGEIAAQRGLQAAFGQLDADLRSAARDPAVTTTLPGVLPGNGELVLLRQTPSVENGMLRYQMVRYAVRDHALLRSVRTVTSPAEIDALLSVAVWPDALDQVLARDIESWSMRVWTAQGWAAGNEAAVATLAKAQALGLLAQTRPADTAGLEFTLRTTSGDEFVRALMVRQ